MHIIISVFITIILSQTIIQSPSLFNPKIVPIAKQINKMIINPNTVFAIALLLPIAWITIFDSNSLIELFILCQIVFLFLPSVFLLFRCVPPQHVCQCAFLYPCTRNVFRNVFPVFMMMILDIVFLWPHIHRQTPTMKYNQNHYHYHYHYKINNRYQKQI